MGDAIIVVIVVNLTATDLEKTCKRKISLREKRR